MPFDQLYRREIIALLGGAAAAWAARGARAAANDAGGRVHQDHVCGRLGEAGRGIPARLGRGGLRRRPQRRH